MDDDLQCAPSTPLIERALLAICLSAVFCRPLSRLLVHVEVLMFTCDSCLRRAIRSLANTSSPRTAVPSLDRATNSTLTFSRNHVTFESLRQGHHRKSLYDALKKGQKKVDVPTDKPANARAKFNVKQAEAVKNNRLQRLEPEARDKMERAMKQEAKYLVDPLKLAQEIVSKLREHQLEEALALVRASEKSLDGDGVDNVVSWNHIIDWLMGQDSPGEAWKVYQEMKKRGHKPDSYTYTVMLRGYRHNIKKPNVVQQAISVYDSISAANSVVTPTTLHTNAMLSVCSRAHDIDTLWKIAGKLPERGPGAPDHITFTTILTGLNAEIQQRAVEQGAREGPGFDPQPIFDKVIDDARKLWLDVTSRWRRGLLLIDESLTCAMGRLLMLSNNRKTQQDVLNLVHQTMNIPKMTETASEEFAGEAQDTAESEPDEQRPSTFDYVPMRTYAQQDEPPKDLSTVDSSVYSTPANNALSMLIETSTALRELKLGKYYWELLTSSPGPYQVVPDSPTIMAYLRLLRVSRASKAVLDVLQEPRSEYVNNKLMVRGTFIIAMSTCLRDKKNPNVFETASRIMDIMQGSIGMAEIEDLDSSGQKLRFSPKVLRMYLEVAIATTNGLNGEPLQKTKNGDLDFERDRTKNNTLRALKRLDPETFGIKQMIKSYLIELEQQAALRERTIRIKKLLDKRRITPYSTNESIEDLVELLRTMVGAYDKLILINEKLEEDGMGPLEGDLMAECWMQKRKLSAYVTKYANGTVQPGRSWDTRATNRRVDERGPMSSSAQASVQEDLNVHDDAAGSELIATSKDPNLEDPSLPPPSPRSEIFSAIKSAQDRRAKKFDERKLSRRQKIELIKTENIRAQYPVSKLREMQREKRSLKERNWKQLERQGKRMEIGKLDGGADLAERKLPVWKAKAEERRFQHMRKDELKKTYGGWGGRFEELAKEEGGAARGMIDMKS